MKLVFTFLLSIYLYSYLYIYNLLEQIQTREKDLDQIKRVSRSFYLFILFYLQLA